MSHYFDSVPQDGQKAMRLAAMIVLAMLCLLTGLTAIAAGTDQTAQARYDSERAICLKGESGQSRSTCLKEAAAALKEAKAGRLGSERQDDQVNALRRCDRLPNDQRDLCRRRMRGEGTVSGSITGGGVLRELIVVDKPATESKPIQRQANSLE